MNNESTNKMASAPMKSLFWKMGLPMILSMVLQALYNVVDSIFVANMGSEGALANQALTLAFPVQILIVAVGVGTGVGLNALLSKSLGEKNNELVNKVAGNGIFLALVIYLIFLIFGIFGSEWFISLFANGDSEVISMGTSYLRICVCLCLGQIGFNVFERFLQSTGKTNYSMIAQISGAVTNIILDYVFIYPCGMGVVGAACATVTGQFVSLFVAMFFHYSRNKEINGSLKYVRPDMGIIKGIYSIGFTAALMQGLLSVMMAGVNAILNGANADPTILVGSFGIYYKIQQIALFAAFGLSNTIISILSFNYGMKDKERSKQCVRYGIEDTVLVSLIITIAFEILAKPLTSLFGLAGDSTTEIIDVCVVAIRIASLGYIFMGFSVAVQGVLQALGKAVQPLIISLCRLVIFVFPIAYLFCRLDNVADVVWWTFPIAEVITCIISVFILKNVYQKEIETLPEDVEAREMAAEAGIMITIGRQHGTNGKQIAKAVAQKLGMSFYDKEEVKSYALDQHIIDNKDDNELYDRFLSLDVESNPMIQQKQAITEIEKKGNFVMVGRGSDYVQAYNPGAIKIFLYAPLDYRIKNVQENYNDSYEDAKKNIKRADSNRSKYYELITNQSWGAKENYDLCINCAIGKDRVVEIICDYINMRK